MDYQSIYQSKKKSPEKLLELIRDRDYIFVAPPQGSKGAPCQRHSPTFHQRAAQDAGSFDV